MREFGRAYCKRKVGLAKTKSFRSGSKPKEEGLKIEIDACAHSAQASAHSGAGGQRTREIFSSRFSLHNILNQSITSHNVTTHVAGHELSHEHMLTRDPAPTSTTLREERRTAVTDRNSDMYMLLLYM